MRPPRRLPLLLLFAALSALATLPCLWQSRIQAGDLSSHVYNAWLASELQQGRAPGLAIAHPWTNVLADWLLLSLTKLAGPAAAQRLLIGSAVLIFLWGAFSLARLISGRRPWFLLPCLAMLAYGWVFHAGFVNFYLSMGLCLWALAGLWPRCAAAVPQKLAAIPLLALALLAHALPVAWALAAAVYVWLARRTRRPIALAAVALSALVALRILITVLFPAYASPRQLLLISGADQLWVYGPAYLLFSVALLLLWLVLFRQLVRRRDLAPVWRSPPFQLTALTAAGVALLPTAVQLPQYRHALWFISDRLSLAVAVLVCALLAAAKPARPLKAALAVLAGVYFGFLYFDARRSNRLEDRLQALLDTLPARQRVVNTLTTARTRLDPLAHLLDRACAGRCYSYGNYEPSSGQFRLRAVAASPVVLSDFEDIARLQRGAYVVRQRDLPLYAVTLAPGGELCLRRLALGEKILLRELR